MLMARPARDCSAPLRTRAVPVAALAAGCALAVACVVETEPAAPRPLLRDTLRARAATQAPRDAEAPPLVPPPPPPPPPPDAFRGCEKDSDCAAVLRNGCCHDGRNEAINRGLVDAYQASFVCPVARPLCPTQLVLDRRVPACDAASHTCKLVEALP